MLDFARAEFERNRFVHDLGHIRYLISVSQRRKLDFFARPPLTFGLDRQDTAGQHEALRRAERHVECIKEPRSSRPGCISSLTRSDCHADDLAYDYPSIGFQVEGITSSMGFKAKVRPVIVCGDSVAHFRQPRSLQLLASARQLYCHQKPERTRRRVSAVSPSDHPTTVLHFSL